MTAALTFAKGAALATVCTILAMVGAVLAWIVALVLGSFAVDKPFLFMLAAFAGFLWLFVGVVFGRQREWH